jgi:hypothetical protein
MKLMPGSQGAIAKFLIKWLFVPVGLAALGFFVVGPRLGSPGAPKPAPAEPQIVEPAPEKPKFNGEPEVEVSSRPASRRASSRRRRSSRTSPSPHAVPSRPAEPVTSPDEEPPFTY